MPPVRQPFALFVAVSLLLVAALFAACWVVEQTWLAGASRDALRWFFLARGVGASLLVLALALALLGNKLRALEALRRTEKQVEEALRASEQRHRVISELTSDYAYECRIEPGGKVVIESATEGFGRVTGYTVAEVEARGGWVSLLHPDELPPTGERTAELLAGRRSVWELRILTKGGETRWVRYSTHPVWDPKEERVVRFFGAVQDVTGRRRADQERERLLAQLELERARFEAVLRQMPAGVGIVEVPTGRLLLGNERLASIFRHPGPLAAGPPPPEWDQAFHADGRPYRREDWPVVRAITTGETVLDEEIEILRGDGSRGTICVNAGPIRDRRGEVVAGVAAVYDVTEQKKAEAEGRRRHRELAALNGVAAAVSRSLELPEVLATLKALLAEELEVAGGAAFFYNEAGHRFSLRLSWGLPPELLADFMSFRACGYVAEPGEGGAALRPRGDQATPFAMLRRRALPLGWSDYLEVPLEAQGSTPGVVCLFGKAAGSFRPDDHAFFTALGRQVGVAVQNARLFEQVRAGRERLQALSARLVQVQEAERRHLARELHDEVGQTLTGLKFVLGGVARAEGDDRAAGLGQAQNLVNRLMTQVRDLSLALRPAMLDDLGLLPALLWHFDRYTAQTHVQVRFEHTGLERRFPPETETAAYRIVQEALTNVARHAGVGEATVRAWADGDNLCLQVEDQGRGFDPEAAGAAGACNGLAGMRERAYLLGGHLAVESAAHEGARLTAELPLGGNLERRRHGADARLGR